MYFKIELVILARNRLDYLKENFLILFNILRKEKHIYLKISDNSNNNKIKLYFDKFANLGFINFKYIERSGSLTANQHYDIVLSESEYDYTIIFHDDDYISQDYFKKVSNAILKYPSAVAIGTNANLIKNNILTKKKSHYYNNNIEFKNKYHFLKNFLTGSDGICPFPSYIYKTKYIKKISFTKIDAGKHSDVIFLSNLLDKGTIVWLKDKLMNYRVHALQDSKVESILSRISLKNYFISNSINKKDIYYLLFNLFYRYNLYRQYLRNNKNKRIASRIYNKYFISLILKLVCKLEFYKILIKKLYRYIF